MKPLFLMTLLASNVMAGPPVMEAQLSLTPTPFADFQARASAWAQEGVEVRTLAHSADNGWSYYLISPNEGLEQAIAAHRQAQVRIGRPEPTEVTMSLVEGTEAALRNLTLDPIVQAVSIQGPKEEVQVPIDPGITPPEFLPSYLNRLRTIQ